jgi:hypothetical protein
VGEIVHLFTFQHFGNVLIGHFLLTVPKPQLDVAVFIKVKEDIGDVQLPEDNEPIFFQKGEMYLVRYLAIRDLLLQNVVDIV